ncbi:MAG: hypothetical protein DMG38_23005 [Acidobacteria bacterium]|nr:MAG: hypothetical protein DMG38_23005 [Acidobacteriota bacterium]
MFDGTCNTGSTATPALNLQNDVNSEFGKIVPGVFTPVLAKHSKNFSLEDSLSIGVDRNGTSN